MISNDKNNDDNLVNEIFSMMPIEIFDKKPNCIFLANSNDQNNIDDSFKRKDKTQFFENLKNKIQNSICYFHFINVKNISTYFEFLTNLSQLVFDCKNSTNENIFEKFRFIDLANISGYYI